MVFQSQFLPLSNHTAVTDHVWNPCSDAGNASEMTLNSSRAEPNWFPMPLKRKQKHYVGAFPFSFLCSPLTDLWSKTIPHLHDGQQIIGWEPQPCLANISIPQRLKHLRFCKRNCMLERKGVETYISNRCAWYSSQAHWSEKVSWWWMKIPTAWYSLIKPTRERRWESRTALEWCDAPQIFMDTQKMQ